MAMTEIRGKEQSNLATKSPEPTSGATSVVGLKSDATEQVDLLIWEEALQKTSKCKDTFNMMTKDNITPGSMVLETSFKM